MASDLPRRSTTDALTRKEAVTKDESLIEAPNQLLYYHCDRRQCMNSLALDVCAARGAELSATDDLSFAVVSTQT